MKMRPRQELLDIWKAVIKTSWHNGQWRWGGKFEANSISDAEQLLCLLLPAVKLDSFGLDRPEHINEAVLDHLKPFGERLDIPRRLIVILLGYFETYLDDGNPVFSGGSYYDAESGEPTAKQRSLDIVDSFAMSITLSLATLGFVRVYRDLVKRGDVRSRCDRLEALASQRLTAAMVGLLRSFSVNVFDAKDEKNFGAHLLRTLNQGGEPASQVVARFRRMMRQTVATMQREILIGSGQVQPSRDPLLERPDLDNETTLFEIGWSWGTVVDAPEIFVDVEERVVQPPGIAENAPYLYFTVIAMDAIEDLFSERTRLLGLLNAEQQRLAKALELRSDLTRGYWANLATFESGGRWPLEDIPWKTTDGVESDYLTLQVSSLAVKGLSQNLGIDADLARIGAVLTELANRSRITRRPLKDDVAVKMHTDGLKLTLVGSEQAGDSILVWRVVEFAPLLLHRIIAIAGKQTDARQRNHMLEQADLVWQHLIDRRLQGADGADLWDRPEGAFESEPASKQLVSWYYTERVVQTLVSAARVLDNPPLRSDRMTAIARDLLVEAEQILDNELLSRGSAGRGPAVTARLTEIEAFIRRARELVVQKPGTAAALATQALLLLDGQESSRRHASEVI